jgi:hypothetical protein
MALMLTRWLLGTSNLYGSKRWLVSRADILTVTHMLIVQKMPEPQCLYGLYLFI